MASRIWAGLLALWALAAALASVLAHAGFGSAPGMLAHFAPFFLSAVVPLALAAFWTRLPWRLATLAAGIVSVVATGLLMAPEFLRDAGPQAPSGRPGQIKIIQLNALRSNADIVRVADWLIAERPDVVTITEARHDLRDLLVKRAGWKTAGAAGTLMIFTPRQYVRMDRPTARRGAPLAFVNATYETPGGPIEVVTAHFNRSLAPSVAGQALALESIVEQRPRARMILSGDFNATPWSAELRRLDRTLGLFRRDRGVATWPAQLSGRAWRLPFMPIDHVYAGPEWSTVSVERGPWLGSGHYPVIVTLAPNER